MVNETTHQIHYNLSVRMLEKLSRHGLNVGPKSMRARLNHIMQIRGYERQRNGKDMTTATNRNTP